jgi:5-formyltetrahydrofolate cyclo-ligase
VYLAPVSADPEADSVLRSRAKALLRQRARALREAIPREAILSRSARIVARLEHLPVFTQARSVALFWPMEGRNEVDLTTLDARARAAHKTLYYPLVDSDARALSFRRVDDPTQLRDRGLGIREPDPGAPEPAALDLIVVPALGVDARGHRIGYGGGYYDLALPRFCPPAHTIAVVFAFQLLAEVPNSPRDVAISVIVTDDRVIAPAQEPG